ncbi:2',3'-cyclic-nucleotide 3'-phosphodiesterase [Pelobates fuscus]|uniref:2',3'-cyclic-nucleotide 3'-phosphodiesterase n=1 Tax=Pelobates fuscus TaxID=191477 RepID=UPI002FE4CBD2
MLIRLSNTKLLFTTQLLLLPARVLQTSITRGLFTCCKVTATLKRSKPLLAKTLNLTMSTQAAKDHTEGHKIPLLVDDHTVTTVRESKILVILRGLPGSGKTSLAKEIEQKFKDNSRLISADNHNIKPAIRPSDEGEYSKMDEELNTCCERREANLVILDDTHHDQERLNGLFDLANKYHFTVLILEPKTPWRLDCGQLKDRNHWKLSLEELKNLRPTLEKELVPLYFGWFVTKRDEDTLRKTSQDFLEHLSNFKPFRKRLQAYGYEDKHKLDLLKYFGKTPNILHCTTKYCDYGKVAGSEEYAQMEAVKKGYSKAYTLHITALFVTPRTAGAHVELTEEQLTLWPQDAEKEVMPKDTFPKGSRAHITLGTAADVQDVQTGIDLLEFIKLQQSGGEKEDLGEICGGKIYYYENGMWMLNLSRKIEVKTIFSGYYGKAGVTAPQRGGKKALLPTCEIM